MIAGSNSVKWLITGRVQGVGFRWFVYRKANELGILGWTRNLPDGRVEVVGVGELSDLDRLERHLWKGPSFARVDDVVRADQPHEVGAFKSFEIK